jgi:hypothetical protein
MARRQFRERERHLHEDRPYGLSIPFLPVVARHPREPLIWQKMRSEFGPGQLSFSPFNGN